MRRLSRQFIPPHRRAVVLSLYYLLFGTVWILATDFALFYGQEASVREWMLSLGKGLVFVGISALVVYRLMFRELSKYERIRNLLHSVLDGTSDAVYMKDTDGIYQLANRATEAITGVASDTLIGCDDHALFDESTTKAIQETDARLLATGESLHLEQQLTIQGEIRHFSTIKNAMRDETGAVIGIIGVSREITTQKKAHEEIRLGQERLNFALAAAGMGVWEWDVATNQVHWSQEAKMICGLARSIGNVDEFEQIVHPDDFPGLMDAARHAIETKSDFRHEFRIRRPSGEIRHLADYGRGLYSENGLVRLVGIVDDITERHRADLALRAERDRFSALVASLPGAAYTFRMTPDGKMTVPFAAAKLEEFYGLTIRELAEDFSPAFERIHPDDQARMFVSIRKSAETLSDWRDECRILSPKLGEIWVEGYSRPSRAEDGSTIWHGYIADVTTRKKSAQAIVEKEERFRAFIGNSPLAAWVSDSNGILLNANHRFEEIFRCVLEKSGERRLADLLPKELAERLDAGRLETLASGQTVERTITFQGAAGEEREAILIKFPIPRSRETPLVGAFAMDVTDYRRAEERLMVLGAAIESSPNGVFIANEKGLIRWANKALCTMSGYSFNELLNQRPSILKSGRHPDSHYQRFWETISAGKVWVGEMIERSKEGSEYVVRQIVTPLCGVDGKIAHYVAVQENITSNKHNEARLRDLATTDPLTGLLNRAGFRERMFDAIQAGERVALHFLDLDRFKFVNDAFGHHAGDELLHQVAERLLRRVRSTDIVARLGGDEFAIIQPGIRSTDDASALAQGLIQVVGRPYRINEEDVRVGATIGIALSPDHANDADSLLRNADLAMYSAKQLGRGTFCFFSATFETQVQARVSLESEIRRGLEREEFRLYYQPQLALAGGKPIGAEALVRWRHPTRGIVPPGEFLPVAEDSGLILPMSDWILREACRQGRLWRDAGTPLRIAVNVSVSQVKRGDLAEVVEAALKESELEPELLELEITENLLLPDVPESGTVLKRLKELGVRMAIDDFGTGYSSLSYLRRLPVHLLKIDRSFVAGVPGDTRDETLVRAIVGLGHDLGLRVLAEGVETEAQLEFLRKEGCDEAQGYFFGRPVPAEEFRFPTR